MLYQAARIERGRSLSFFGIAKDWNYSITFARTTAVYLCRRHRNIDGDRDTSAWIPGGLQGGLWSARSGLLLVVCSSCSYIPAVDCLYFIFHGRSSLSVGTGRGASGNLRLQNPWRCLVARYVLGSRNLQEHIVLLREAPRTVQLGLTFICSIPTRVGFVFLSVRFVSHRLAQFSGGHLVMGGWLEMVNYKMRFFCVWCGSCSLWSM